MGEDGFNAGRATYIWHAKSGRYSLVATAEATGITSLFVRGRIIQVSEGTLDAGGLRPEQFWQQRGERPKEIARFDWSRNLLNLNRKGITTHPLTPQSQDLLSFPFHLAMTARDSETDFTLGITNGRKFRPYVFQSLGRETIQYGNGQRDTIHLRGGREGEGNLDVWLAPDLAGLPLRIQTLDQDGKALVLLAERIELPGE